MAGKYGSGDTSWFVKDRFGMFIHFGLYAQAARHEWIRSREFINDEDYQIYFDLFNPDLFDPRAWARSAKNAGMKYFVFTAKHHEGFCMWDTKYTDYKITNTPFGRDALKEIIEAFRAEGLKVGIYYSLLDWHHPDFTIDNIHPLRHLPTKEIVKLNKSRDMHRYAQYMRDQVTELLTQYGKIDIMWFDFSYKENRFSPDYDLGNIPWQGKGAEDWEAEKLLKLIRKLQPNVIIDNRLGLPGSGDIMTPEQFTPETAQLDEDGNPIVWEGCQTFSGSWGYYRDEYTWKSAKQCIELLINHVSLGGNLLMNVGPTGRGVFDARAEERLADFGKWMKYHSRAIYDCGAVPEGIIAPRDCRYTYNKTTNRLYLHLFAWPFKSIQLPGLADNVRYAQLLNDASEIKVREGWRHLYAMTQEGAVTLDLPVRKPDFEVPVIEIFLKKPLN